MGLRPSPVYWKVVRDYYFRSTNSIFRVTVKNPFCFKELIYSPQHASLVNSGCFLVIERCLVSRQEKVRLGQLLRGQKVLEFRGVFGGLGTVTVEVVGVGVVGA